MSSGFLNNLGVEVLIQNEVLDEGAVLRSLNNFLLDESAVLNQIFFDTIVPTAPLLGMLRLYEIIDVRLFNVTDTRIFNV